MIRVVENQDKAAWFTFDKHLPITEFNEKVRYELNKMDHKII